MIQPRVEPESLRVPCGCVRTTQHPHASTARPRPQIPPIYTAQADRCRAVRPAARPRITSRRPAAAACAAASDAARCATGDAARGAAQDARRRRVEASGPPRPRPAAPSRAATCAAEALASRSSSCAAPCGPALEGARPARNRARRPYSKERHCLFARDAVDSASGAGATCGSKFVYLATRTVKHIIKDLHVKGRPVSHSVRREWLTSREHARNSRDNFGEPRVIAACPSQSVAFCPAGGAPACGDARASRSVCAH